MGLQTNLTKMKAVNTRAQGHMAVRGEETEQKWLTGMSNFFKNVQKKDKEKCQCGRTDSGAALTSFGFD